MNDHGARETGSGQLDMSTTFNERSRIHIKSLDADPPKERLAVDQHLYAVLLDPLIKLASLIRRHVFQVVTHPRTPLVPHPDPNQPRPAVRI